MPLSVENLRHDLSAEHSVGFRGAVLSATQERLPPANDRYWKELRVDLEQLAHPKPDNMFEEIVRRGFDIAFSIAMILITLPFLVLLAIALQIDSPGKLFFVQQRIGLKGKAFPCFKFRTMCEDAESVLTTLLQSSPEARAEWERDHKLRDDPRVSRLGRVIRKLSLDELPQLWNILLGHMSVVGPRPIVQAEIPRYGKYFVDYCHVKPGLTGLWQVSGRNDVSYEERVQLDCQYRMTRSLALDFSILLRTVPAVLGAKGSY